MRLYELVVMGSILVLCAAGVVWLFKDMARQLKAYEERCESLDDDKEE